MPGVPRTPRVRLLDMLDAIEGIRTAVAGLDYKAYERGWIVRRAVERGLEIISEASRHVPDHVKVEHPGVPWRQIAGIGNVLRHEYQRVEDRLIWNVVCGHPDTLEGAVRSALASLPDSR